MSHTPADISASKYVFVSVALEGRAASEPAGDCSRTAPLTDDVADSLALPVETQTARFCALITHVTEPRGGKGKEGEVGGVLRARRGVFLYAL